MLQKIGSSIQQKVFLYLRTAHRTIPSHMHRIHNSSRTGHWRCRRKLCALTTGRHRGCAEPRTRRSPASAKVASILSRIVASFAYTYTSNARLAQRDASMDLKLELQYRTVPEASCRPFEPKKMPIMRIIWRLQESLYVDSTIHTGQVFLSMPHVDFVPSLLVRLLETLP